MINRPRVVECLEGYEWQFKRHLEQIDRLARQLHVSLAYAGLLQHEIQPVMTEWFAQMWEQVAATEEIKRGRRGA